MAVRPRISLWEISAHFAYHFPRVILIFKYKTEFTDRFIIDLYQTRHSETFCLRSSSMITSSKTSPCTLYIITGLGSTKLDRRIVLDDNCRIQMLPSFANVGVDRPRRLSVSDEKKMQANHNLSAFSVVKRHLISSKPFCAPLSSIPSVYPHKARWSHGNRPCNLRWERKKMFFWIKTAIWVFLVRFIPASRFAEFLLTKYRWNIIRNLKT